MEKILVPVDLTQSGDNAVKIAEKLATNEHAEIMILNIVPPPSGAVFMENGQVKDDGEIELSEHKKTAENNLNELKERYAFLPNKAFVVEIGDINNIIINKLKNETFSLLVLGMSGQLTSSFWSDSHTEYLSKYTNVPVLTIKCDRSGMLLDKILFVSDFLDDEKIDLSIIRELSRQFKAKLILLKIVTNDQQRSDDEIMNKAESFAEKNQLENYEIVIYSAGNIEDGIAMFSEENNIDLIAIGTHQRGGFSTLFRRSISQDIVRNLYHPIITIPIRQA